MGPLTLIIAKFCSLNSQFFLSLVFRWSKSPLFCCPHALFFPGPFLPAFVRLLSLAWLRHAEGRVATSAVTAGLKYPDDTRVGSNETPDRCLHKPAAVSAEHGRLHSERWGWLWAVTHVPGVRVAARCVERRERRRLLNIHVHRRADRDRVAKGRRRRATSECTRHRTAPVWKVVSIIKALTCSPLCWPHKHLITPPTPPPPSLPPSLPPNSAFGS